MDSPFIVPLAAFAVAAIIVAITQLAKIRDLEIEVRRKLHFEEMEHQRKMKGLNEELERLKLGS